MPVLNMVKRKRKAEVGTPVTVKGEQFSDDLLIASKDGNVQPQHNKEAASVSLGRYYTYEDYVAEGKGWSNMGKSEWQLMIGFIAIRIGAPLILIIHTLMMMGFMYTKYNFDFSNPQLVEKFPFIVAPLCGNLLVVQFFSKLLFKRNYYRQRMEE
ncbi:hypothetical protein FOA43_001299 [Brettanomyces nanus]|uniref:Uncharacterized protein n=1 Tax=Eeniella nana TaxID=13502 RepID=A0A875RZA2_EENNA|nr:uncharacterized protein FOA43_001299 [Brettanomyces nanus]QPG73983.1 hypothetical protein FOA43_001299 [Brettanomyces nanus]